MFNFLPLFKQTHNKIRLIFENIFIYSIENKLKNYNKMNFEVMSKFKF